MIRDRDGAWRAFRAIGRTRGGDRRSLKDYMHFSAKGREPATARRPGRMTGTPGRAAGPFGERYIIIPGPTAPTVPGRGQPGAWASNQPKPAAGRGLGSKDRAIGDVGPWMRLRRALACQSC